MSPMGNTAAAGRTPKSGAWDAEEIFKLLPYFFTFGLVKPTQKPKGRLIQSREENEQNGSENQKERKKP